MLNPDQKDALQEYMNIFTGHAAALLSEMVNKKIDLSITELQLFHLKDEPATTQSPSAGRYNLPSLFRGHIVSSSIRFGHQFSGKAYLIFPVEASKELVRLCLEEDDDMELHIPGELTDTDYDAIREMGNIILNAITGGLGNLLEVPLEFELPEVQVLSSFNPADERDNGKTEKYVLIFFNTFSVRGHVVEGAIVVVLSMDSIAMLLEKIDEVLKEIDA